MNWDGRETIEIVPQISNLEAMQRRAPARCITAGPFPAWSRPRTSCPASSSSSRRRNSGKLQLAVAVSNGGQSVTRAVEIAVNEPVSDPWVYRTPEKDEKPEEGQFYARDDKNEGTLFYNGRLDAAADAVFLKVYAGDKPFANETKQLPADRSYAFTVKLKPGLIAYRVEFGTKTGEREKVLNAVGDLVCGDAYLIDGQSNALATDTGEKSPPDTSPWIRSYGGPTGRGDATGWVDDRMQEARRAGAHGRTSGATRSGRRNTARRPNSAIGAWSLPNAWWLAGRCRCSSSTGPSAARESTSISRHWGTMPI